MIVGNFSSDFKSDIVRNEIKKDRYIDMLQLVLNQEEVYVIKNKELNCLYLLLNQIKKIHNKNNCLLCLVSEIKSVTNE